MHRPFLITAISLAGVAVILGAFGAHSLKQFVPPETISTFETGVRYQFYHSFALLVTAMLYEKFRNKRIRFAGYSFISGIVLFSGSLYLLTWLKATASAGLSGIGILTPVGGLFFIAGWVALLAGIMDRKSSSLKSI